MFSAVKSLSILDLMLESSASLAVHHVPSGELAAVCLNCLWETDPGYDAFQVKAEDWFNVAGDIAVRI